jgi:HSP90 family molecular chaperone
MAGCWCNLVEIFIPEKHGAKLTIEDNGIGMTKDEFYSRWMKLGYNRLKNIKEKS